MALLSAGFGYQSQQMIELLSAILHLGCSASFKEASKKGREVLAATKAGSLLAPHDPLDVSELTSVIDAHQRHFRCSASIATFVKATGTSIEACAEAIPFSKAMRTSDRFASVLLLGGWNEPASASQTLLIRGYAHLWTRFNSQTAVEEMQDALMMFPLASRKLADTMFPGAWRRGQLASRVHFHGLAGDLSCETFAALLRNYFPGLDHKSSVRKVQRFEIRTPLKQVSHGRRVRAVSNCEESHQVPDARPVPSRDHAVDCIRSRRVERDISPDQRQSSLVKVATNEHGLGESPKVSGVGKEPKYRVHELNRQQQHWRIINFLWCF
jgi:hypothetical protein